MTTLQEGEVKIKRNCAKRYGPGDPCPYCAKTLEEEFFKQREAKRVAAIKMAALKNKYIGRPRSIQYAAIYIFADRGYSQRVIAEKLGISKGSVEHALSIRGTEKEHR